MYYGKGPSAGSCNWPLPAKPGFHDVSHRGLVDWFNDERQLSTFVVDLSISGIVG